MKRKSFFKQHWQKIITLVILGLAVHLVLPQIASLEHSWKVLVSLAPWALILAFAVQTLSYAGSGYLVQSILLITNQFVSLLRGALIVLGSVSVGMVAGGMVGSAAAIYRWTSTEDSRPESATLASVLPALFNTLILVFLSIFGLIHLLIVHDLSRMQLIGFSVIILILGFFIGIIFLALRNRDRALASVISISRRFSSLRRQPFDPSSATASTQNFFAAWDSLRSGAWKKTVAGALLSVLFDILTLYFLFLAAGHNVSPGVLLAGYGLPLLLGKVAFIVPGGVGVVEGSMVALYDNLGVPDPVTVVVVLGYRLISFWLPSLSGFPIAAYLQHARKKING